MDKSTRRLWTYLLLTVLLLTSWSGWVWQNNTYLTYRDTPVEFVDRYTRQSCVKGFCNDRYEGRFRTDDGIYFERGIGNYMYHRMHLGERMVLELRPMDIRQNTWDNTVWMFGPIVLYIITGFAWAFLLVALGSDTFDYFKAKRAINGKRKTK